MKIKKAGIFLLCLFTAFFLFGCEKNYYNPDKTDPPTVQKGDRIVLDKNELSLHIGQTGALSASLLSGNDPLGIRYQSSNTAVVTVDNSGMLFARAPGQATITVSSKTIKEGMTCKVTVLPLQKITFTSNMPLQPAVGGEYTVEVQFSGCTYPSVKVIADCAKGSIHADNADITFGSAPVQYQVIGKTTVRFTLSTAKDFNSIRLIAYDSGQMIDSKEYTVYNTSN